MSHNSDPFVHLVTVGMTHENILGPKKGGIRYPTKPLSEVLDERYSTDMFCFSLFEERRTNCPRYEVADLRKGEHPDTRVNVIILDIDTSDHKAASPEWRALVVDSCADLKLSWWGSRGGIRLYWPLTHNVAWGPAEVLVKVLSAQVESRTRGLTAPVTRDGALVPMGVHVDASNPVHLMRVPHATRDGAVLDYPKAQHPDWLDPGPLLFEAALEGTGFWKICRSKKPLDLGVLHQGSRFNQLNAHGFFLKKTGHTQEQAEARIRQRASECIPPYDADDPELDALCNGISGVEPDEDKVEVVNAGGIVQLYSKEDRAVANAWVKEVTQVPGGEPRLHPARGVMLYKDGTWSPAENLFASVANFMARVVVGKDRAPLQLDTRKVDSVLAWITKYAPKGLPAPARGVPTSHGFITIEDGQVEVQPLCPEHGAMDLLDFEEGEPDLLLHQLNIWWEGLPQVEERVHYLRCWLGACIMGTVTLWNKALLLKGTKRGADGKSTLADLLRSLFPPRMSSVVKLSKVEDRFKLIDLDGSRLNVSDESPSTRDLDGVDTFKTLVSGGETDVEGKGTPFYRIKPMAGWVVCANLLPQVADPGGWFRRWVLFEFPNCHEDSQDHTLPARLAVERGRIVSWALQGYAETCGVPQTAPSSTAKSVKDWARATDKVTGFLYHCTVPQEGGEITLTSLYATFTDWCKGEGVPALGKNKFVQLLVGDGVQMFNPPHSHSRIVAGLALSSEAPGANLTTLRLVK